MLKVEELKQLMIATAKADKSAPTAYSFNEKNYSYDALNDTLRDELNEYAGDYYSFNEHANTIYRLMSETIDEVLPKIVTDRYMGFAETQTVAQGNKPIFKRRVGRNRAKKTFVCRVGLAGLYDVFKLDNEFIEVKMGAVGGAAQMGLEEYLDKKVDFSELLEILMEGMDEAIYAEVAKALEAMYTSIGSYNKYQSNAFDEKVMDQLIATSSAYGVPTIYCTLEFASTMLPADANWISENMKDNRWENGFLTQYKTTKVVILPQSFSADNSEKQIKPEYAYIMAGDEKPVKLAFEGQTIVDEFKNSDRSREIQAYKKFGIATIINGGISIYDNTSLVVSNSIVATPAAAVVPGSDSAHPTYASVVGTVSTKTVE